MTTESPQLNYKIGNERLISVTENAARKLASLLAEKGKPDGALRLKVVGGGCSGLQYVMDLVDDPKSALFVSGSVLDYSEDLQKGGFKVTNPNAVAHCSCGESFAV
ncbi:MAG: iron-sulfur cluster assembly accessory protein [Verrucomicrobia bacterium]|nr:MAG: iron-sulfur cluster assembly accessory protein [Verrucomicrobiota bacterium]